MLPARSGAWATCSPTVRAIEAQPGEHSTPARTQKLIKGARLNSARNGKSPTSEGSAGPPRISPLVESVIPTDCSPDVDSARIRAGRRGGAGRRRRSGAAPRVTDFARYL